MKRDDSRFESLELRAEDGFPVAARLYHPRGRARGVALVSAATGAPQRYYGRFASWLAERELAVVTYDYRGVGDARPRSLRNFPATLNDWVLDARAAYGWTTRHYGADRTVLVGHSFGGQLVGLIPEMRDAAGALFVASQLGYVGNWKGLSRLKVSLFWHVSVPLTTAVLGYLPDWGGMGNALPRDVARQWRRWAMHPDYFVGHEAGARENFARFDAPSLVYSFTDDDIAPKAAVTHLVSFLTGAEIATRRVTPQSVGTSKIGHFGFFRPTFEETLWKPAERFLLDALGDRVRAAA